jgi:GrpB-like predicted nucleotidyltransferase (UPF0157 family)
MVYPATTAVKFALPFAAPGMLAKASKTMSHTLTKPQSVAIAFTTQDIIDLKIIVQDEDQVEGMAFLRKLLRRVTQAQARYCGDPERLPGI